MSNNIDAVAAAWGHDAVNAMRTQLSKYGAVDTMKLARYLRYKLEYKGGELERISFRLKRYGIFLEKGVGRGYKISDVRAAGSALKKRKAKPWFSNAIEPRLGDLADKVTKLKADAAINAIGIKRVTNVGK